MVLKEIQKEICDLSGYTVFIDIAIPIFWEVEVYENDLFDNIIINQVTAGLQQGVNDYRMSPLPNYFIDGQRYIITNRLPSGVLGFYHAGTDETFLDADVMSNIRKVSASFIHGHEIAHKIERYRKMNGLYQDIAHILGMGLSGNQEILSEIYADECANMISSTYYDRGLLRSAIDDDKREYIHKKILYNVYK